MSLFNVYPLNPIAITKAAGSRVWDDKGQEYLDMYGGHAVISIGQHRAHANPHAKRRNRGQQIDRRHHQLYPHAVSLCWHGLRLIRRSAIHGHADVYRATV